MLTTIRTYSTGLFSSARAAVLAPPATLCSRAPVLHVA